jgi:lipoprotein-releasing system permease protein
MTGVAFSTAALIVVLSVFNGLGDLLRSLYSSFDPEIKIELVKGKSFEVTPEMMTRLKNVEGVDIITEVIEDYAYVTYRDASMPVTIKGMADNFLDQHRLDDHLVDGEMKFHDKGVSYAILGRGVQYALSVAVAERLYPLQVFYVKNVKASTIDPSRLYTQRSIMPGGVFSVEKNIDENNIFMPLDFVRDLLDFGNRRTALEIKVKPDHNLHKIQDELKATMGSSFKVLTNEEQHKDLYRLLKYEKLFTFLSLTLLIIVASINIFFSLMMLTIDKKKDISILMAMGADQKLVRNIFLSEGALIAFLGAGIGLVLGGTICWLQDHFGLVGMGMENAIVSSYPVKMEVSDFLITSLVIVTITFIISYYPARLASRSSSIEQL